MSKEIPVGRTILNGMLLFGGTVLCGFMMVVIVWGITVSNKQTATSQPSAEEVARAANDLTAAKPGDMVVDRVGNVAVVWHRVSNKIYLHNSNNTDSEWPIESLAPAIRLVIKRVPDSPERDVWASVFVDQVAGIKEPATKPES